MMETASLTMPSPKTKLNNFGYSLGLTIEIAAITSDEQSSEHIKNTSIFDKTTVDVVLHVSRSVKSQSSTI